MSDIALSPAHALAEAIRHREVSSRELLEHYLARVERLNPPLNAVVTLDPDGARMAADAADAALARGEDRRPAARRADDDQGHLPDRGHAHHVWPRRRGTTCRSTTPRRSDGCAARAR